MGRGTKAATDVYLDAAGAPVVIETALKTMRNRGVLTIGAAHKISRPRQGPHLALDGLLHVFPA